jgi:6-phosphogluconolactonase
MAYILMSYANMYYLKHTIMKKLNYLIACTAGVLLLTFSACKKDESEILSPQTDNTVDITEKGMNPDETAINNAEDRHRFSGFIYTESNATTGNEILIYKQHNNGNLTFKGIVASGGNGVGIFQGLGLDGQGALALSKNKEWLFAVNAGSNSVSSFKIHNNGDLTLVDTETTGGTVPISVCSHRNILYVVNVGSSDIMGYTVDALGDMSAIPGSNLPLSGANVMPAQIAFSPNGDYLYITERATNMITSFSVDANGLATPHMTVPSVGVTPFGFCHARDNYMIVSNATALGGSPVPNASTVTSYDGSNIGNLNDQNGAVPNNQTAACWVADTKFGRFAYITNTGSNTISSYYVSPWGSIYVIDPDIPSGNGPIDITVAANNYYVYNLNSLANTITGYHRTFLGGLTLINTTNNLPDFASGLVAW